MAGQLTIGTLSDGTNSTSTTNLTKAPCTAWIQFNGTGTPTIKGSYNVSSVTGSAGNYTVNFTNAMVDANYSCVGGCGINGQGSVIKIGNVWSASAVSVDSATYSNNWTAAQFISIAVFR